MLRAMRADGGRPFVISPLAAAVRRLSSRLPPEARPGFVAGTQAMGPAVVGIAAWGLVTGVAMSRSGLSTPQAVGMSLLVFAGSAQLASLPLMAAGLPIWTVLLTATLVNVRFVIFSAGIQPHFKHHPLALRTLIGYLNGDLNFVLFTQRHPTVDGEPGKEAFFFGVSATNWLAWQVSSIAGILLATQIPDAWGVGFAGTLALIALVLPLAARWPVNLAVAVAGLVAVAWARLPYRLNIVLAVAAAIAVGVAADELGARSRRPAAPVPDDEERRKILRGEEIPD
jgi:predicted branched-subunit amino acid permease